MARRRLVCTADDDGVTVTISVDEYVTVGSTEIGPTQVFHGQLMSFPCLAVDDWRRDMAVLFVERL